MKTKNSKRFVLLCLLLLSVAGVQAQTMPSWKYPKVENGNTIISRDAAGGIKTKGLLTTEQKAFLMNQIMQPTYHERSEYNRVSAKFQVATADTGFQYTFPEAYDECKKYSQDGSSPGSWRVPTQRELVLIYILKSQLTACEGLSARSTLWSGTRHSEEYQGQQKVWTVGIEDGQASDIPIIRSTAKVRCIRDL